MATETEFDPWYHILREVTRAANGPGEPLIVPFNNRDVAPFEGLDSTTISDVHSGIVLRFAHAYQVCERQPARFRPCDP